MMVFIIINICMEIKLRMAAPLSDGLVEYGDGTEGNVEQMSKDVTTFLMWAAEPHLRSLDTKWVLKQLVI